jgi:hypothetical protein
MLYICIKKLKKEIMNKWEIRKEIAELINGGMMNVTKIKGFFKTHRPGADMKIVAEEAKELVMETKEELKKYKF